MTDDHDKILCERLATSIDHGICKCAERSRIAAIGRELDYARNELAAERERREAAEWVLKEIRIRPHAAGRRPEECWEMSEIDGHFAHFARKGER